MAHGSLTHAKAMGHLLRRQPLLLEVLDVVIACLSLRSVRRDRPLDLLAWSGAPFLNRDPNLSLSRCWCWFCFLRSVLELGENARQQVLNGFR